MPIYAYRCAECGFAKDVLQKMSDPVLTVCLSCGKDTFKKQLTAAGFQLKGTGWYATDFRGGKAPATAVAPETGVPAATTPAAATPAASGNGAGNGSANAAATPAAPAAPAKPSSSGGSAT